MLELFYASMTTGARLEYHIKNWEFKTMMTRIKLADEEFVLVDSKYRDSMFSESLPFPNMISFTGDDIPAYHKMLRLAFSPDYPEPTLIKLFIKEHVKGEMGLYQELVQAMAVGDPDQIEFQYHRVRAWLRTGIPGDAASDSRWWLYYKTGKIKYLDMVQRTLAELGEGKDGEKDPTTTTD